MFGTTTPHLFSATSVEANGSAKYKIFKYLLQKNCKTTAEDNQKYVPILIQTIAKIAFSLLSFITNNNNKNNNSDS